MNAGYAEGEEGGDEVGRQALDCGRDDFKVLDVKALERVGVRAEGERNGVVVVVVVVMAMVVVVVVMMTTMMMMMMMTGWGRAAPARPWRHRQPASARGREKDEGGERDRVNMGALEFTRRPSKLPAAPAAEARQHCLPLELLVPATPRLRLPPSCALGRPSTLLLPLCLCECM